jgi:hypothetical protein
MNLLADGRNRTRGIAMKTNTFSLYHYTDQRGYQSLTSGNAIWYPSFGPQPDYDQPLTDQLATAPAFAAAVFCEDDFAKRRYDELPTGPFHDVDYGPGWYLTSLPPSS